MENQADSQTHDPPDLNSRPTHRLQNVKVGDNGVQLLMSTKDHLYDARGVEAGQHSYQVIGAWEEGSVQELVGILSPRQAKSNNDSAGTVRSSQAYGPGQKLGSADTGNGRQAVVRQHDERSN